MAIAATPQTALSVVEGDTDFIGPQRERGQFRFAADQMMAPDSVAGYRGALSGGREPMQFDAGGGRHSS